MKREVKKFSSRRREGSFRDWHLQGFEVSADTELPKVALIELPGGNIVEQKIEYEWIPPTCSKCKCFGHISQHCPLPQVWVRKDATQGTQTADRDEGNDGQAPEKRDGTTLHQHDHSEASGTEAVTATGGEEAEGVVVVEEEDEVADTEEELNEQSLSGGITQSQDRKKGQPSRACRSICSCGEG